MLLVSNPWVWLEALGGLVGDGVSEAGRTLGLLETDQPNHVTVHYRSEPPFQNHGVPAVDDDWWRLVYLLENFVHHELNSGLHLVIAGKTAEVCRHDAFLASDRGRAKEDEHRQHGHEETEWHAVQVESVETLQLSHHVTSSVW